MGGNVTFTGKAKEYYESHSKNSTTSLNTNLPNNQRHVKVETLGWDKTCKCDTDKTKRQTILDPFSGSGTSGLAALNINCNYIGLELNNDYAEQSREILKNRLFDIEQSIF